MGRYRKTLFSRFPRLERQLQHQFEDFFSSRSKYLPDIPATPSESERTRRSAAPSPEVSPKKIIRHEKETTDTSIDLQSITTELRKTESSSTHPPVQAP
jgi:hypothetical protein